MTEIRPSQYLYQEEIYKINPKFLVVIDKPWPEVTGDEKILLEKILNALKLTLASVQILTRAEFSIEDFRAYSPSFILAFGSKLRNSDTMYNEIKVNETTIVVSDALDQLDETKKRNLWLTLRQVVNSK